MSLKTHFVYDKETGFILSGFDCYSDTEKDGHNIYTRPFKYPEFHSNNEKCRLDYIFNSARKEGLKDLKYENLTVVELDGLPHINQVFVKNPNYLIDKQAVRGWWKYIDNTEVEQ